MGRDCGDSRQAAADQGGVVMSLQRSPLAGPLVALTRGNHTRGMFSTQGRMSTREA